MIDSKVVKEIVETYRKYDWRLRRILTTADSRPVIEKALDGRLDYVTVGESNIDAAWFSRLPGFGPVAWEIRYLGGFPFALLEMLDERSPEFEDMLGDVESRLAEALKAKTSA